MELALGNSPSSPDPISGFQIVNYKIMDTFVPKIILCYLYCINTLPNDSLLKLLIIQRLFIYAKTSGMNLEVTSPKK